MRVIAIDIGNTNIVVGLYDGMKLTNSWRIDSNISRTVDDYGHLITYMIERTGCDVKEIGGVVIGSVVPPLTYVFDKLSKRYFFLEPHIVNALKNDLGLRYDVESPLDHLGADRVANTLAIKEKYGVDSIVVDLGTATTFDLVTADGTYLGGVIAPGIKTCADTLARRAAMLSEVQIEVPPSIIGRNTEDMMKAGIFFGAVGQVDEIVRRLKAEWKRECTVIATGGFVSMMERYSSELERIDANLTLDGLRFAFEKMK